jgi:hypothetical protein
MSIFIEANTPVQSTGAFIAVSRYASATPCPPSVMSRGIGWQVSSKFLSLQLVYLEILNDIDHLTALYLTNLSMCHSRELAFCWVDYLELPMEPLYLCK